MILLFFWLAAWVSPGPDPLPNKAVQAGVPGLLSRRQYEQLFPHHNALYTYDAFIKAAAYFPLFAGEGSPEMRKRELAAFFAHAAHETTSGGPGSAGGPYVWGLIYIEETGCRDGHCTVYNTAGSSVYTPVPGKSYYGRGPLQLSYAYNYGLAGDEMRLPLLAHPELVSHDGVIAFRAAIWFWMRSQRPKPSCHDVIGGKWTPTAEDLSQGRKPGFGMTINIINGGIECRSKDAKVKGNRGDRIGFYRRFANLLGTTAGPDCDCADMAPYQ
jgi:chitinase